MDLAPAGGYWPILIVVVGAFANALARSRHEAQRAVEIQAWRLRQLLPAA